MSEPRPGTESVPWRDPYGWHEQRNSVMRTDPNDGSKNFKMSTVIAAGDLTWSDITYHVTTVRHEGEHVVFVEWIDEMGKPQRIRLPAAVMDRFISHRQSLIKENRSRRSKESWDERRAL